MTADRILWNPGRKEVDEIVAYGVTVHLEQMSERSWWMGIYSADDKRRLCVNFYVLPGKRKAMTVTCEEDMGDWVWDKDEEHPE